MQPAPILEILPDPLLITTYPDLVELAGELSHQPLLAVDTESNGLHAYREQVCLVQFSTPETDYLVDPLALEDLSPLAPLFANPQIEKIFHAAEYDLLCLQLDYSFTFANLFDTMLAARILGRPVLGLGPLLESEFDIRLDKRHQRADWGKRPLAGPLLSYARLDTHYLIRLRHLMPAAFLGSTKVSLAEIFIGANNAAATEPGVYVMRTAMAPFGHNAPPQPSFNSDGTYVPVEWELTGETDNALVLASRQDKIFLNSWVVVERESDSTPGSRVWSFAKVTGVTQQSVAKYGMAGSVTKLTFDEDVWVTAGAKLDVLSQVTVLAESEALSEARIPLAYPLFGEVLALDSRAEGLVAGRPLAVSGKRQAIRIKHPRPAPFKGHKAPIGPLPPPPTLLLDEGGSVTLSPGDVLRMAGGPSKQIGLEFVPMTPAEFGAALIEGLPPLLRLPLMDRDGLSGVLDISAADIELVAADVDDVSVSEIVFIDDAVETAIIHDRDRTTLQLATSLIHVYERTTVRINANVAAATHGESVKEPLGSGDASVAYQQFTLRQPPLTYVRAETASGATSTLKVYVNEVLWQEVPFFYGHGPTERLYITRQRRRRAYHDQM